MQVKRKRRIRRTKSTRTKRARNPKRSQVSLSSKRDLQNGKLLNLFTVLFQNIVLDISMFTLGQPCLRQYGNSPYA
jgi:hypothetical protein